MTLRSVGILLGFICTAAINARAQSVTVAAVPKLDLAPDVVRALLNRPVTLTLDHVPLARAIDAVVANAGVSALYHSEAIGAVKKLVTLSFTRAPLGEVLAQLLDDTQLIVVPMSATKVGIGPGVSMSVLVCAGAIAGTVTDAKTKRAIAGASVAIDGTSKGVVTGIDGTFRITGIAVGRHTVRVRSIGYTRQVQSVIVSDDTTESLTVALEASANQLDQVIVTGTVVATELRMVPNAMTVITAQDLEARGITHIDQLFRGDVPGVFVQNNGTQDGLGKVRMYVRGANEINFNGSVNGTPIKTYVDGIELSDPATLGQIDPKSIERIEILTGPQASTIYGSNAINGVMQIFTKRGSSTLPHVTASLLSGLVQNNFQSALTPQHDYSAQVSGADAKWMSYSLGGSWVYMGPWASTAQATSVGSFGGMQIQRGPIMADANMRVRSTESHRSGDILAASTAAEETGLYRRVARLGALQPVQQTLNGQTLGITAHYTPTSWWSHEVGFGTDRSYFESRNSMMAHSTIGDSLLSLEQDQTMKTTLRYSSSARFALASQIQGVVTVGGDSWHSLTSSLAGQSTALTGNLNNAFWTVTRQPDHNSGGFVQGQLGIRDALFFTYGLRAEWNPSYGADAQPNLAPKYGAAYTHDLDTPWGVVTSKWRASFGRSTRPPAVGQRSAITMIQNAGYDGGWDAVWGSGVLYQVPNSDLGPETQQGSEGGLDLYFGTRGQLSMTRYDQTVDNLIVFLSSIDSVPSLIPYPSLCGPYSCDAAGHIFLQQNENLNLGSIRNQGWELQGALNIGPIATKGTYSFTLSRVIALTPKYRALATGQSVLAPGDHFNGLPEHTWHIGMTYAQPRTTLSVDLNGIGKRFGTENQVEDDILNSRLDQQKPRMRWQGTVLNNAQFDGYAMADLNATYRLSSTADGVVQVVNLTNLYRQDTDVRSAVLGRQTKVGVRLRF